MSNKQLNENNIVNELKGSSLFFAQDEVHDRPGKQKHRASDSLTRLPAPKDHNLTHSPSSPVSQTQRPLQPATHRVSEASEKISTSPTLPNDPPSTLPSRDISETPPPNPPSNLEDNKNSMPSHTEASADASMLARGQDRLVDEIRKTIKSYGKEISYVRLTPEEKDLLAEITYTYKRQGIKTSENEINRIAVNFLLTDFKENGEASILNCVIQALLA